MALLSLLHVSICLQGSCSRELLQAGRSWPVVLRSAYPALELGIFKPIYTLAQSEEFFFCELNIGRGYSLATLRLVALVFPGMLRMEVEEKMEELASVRAELKERDEMIIRMRAGVSPVASCADMQVRARQRRWWYVIGFVIVNGTTGSKNTTTPDALLVEHVAAAYQCAAVAWVGVASTSGPPAVYAVRICFVFSEMDLLSDAHVRGG